MYASGSSNLYDFANQHSQIIFETTDPYQKDAWSDPVHFDYDGYDTSPFWDVDGTAYIQGSHYWRLEYVHTIQLERYNADLSDRPSIDQVTVDLKTGQTSKPQVRMWTGTGGLVSAKTSEYLMMLSFIRLPKVHMSI